MNRRRQAERDGRDGELRPRRAIERRIGRVLSAEELARVLKADEAARLLGIDLSTLRHMSCRRELPLIHLGKRGVGYQLIDLLEWIDARREPGSA